MIPISGDEPGLLALFSFNSDSLEGNSRVRDSGLGHFDGVVVGDGAQQFFSPIACM